MSRTFRRKNTTQNGMWADLEYFTSTYVTVNLGIWNGYSHFYSERVPLNKSSKEYKAGKARFHSDGGTNSCKEPGPGWFRNMFNTKPSRCGARNEINKWLRNEDYEVVAETHPRLSYWT